MRILCLYSAGLSGTWLTWFVNQHNSFPQFPCHYINNNLPKTDLGCPGATYEFGQYTYESWTNSRDFQKEVENTEFSKTCFKTFPDHDVSQTDEREFINQFTHVIFPYIDPADQSWVERYSFRNSIMWPDKKRDLELFENVYHDLFHSSYYDYFKHLNCHYVNIAKLLDCDHNEYQLLYDFIDERPILDWQHMASEYKNTVFRNYF